MSVPFTAIFAGTFDPPGLTHRRAAELLAADSEVVVVPVPRPAAAGGEISSNHRAVLADLGFRGIPGVRVDLSLLEQSDAAAVPVPEIAARYQTLGGTTTVVVSADAVRGGGAGASRIQTEWPGGPEFWKAGHFTVLVEPGAPLDAADLPPGRRVVEVPPALPAATVRSMLFEGVGADDHLTPDVYAYCRRHGLYAAAAPQRPCRFRPREAKFRLFVDEWNEQSKSFARVLRSFESDDPHMVVAIGGDGTMLRAIRQCWRDRLPFYGINTGGLGFLLSGRALDAFWERELVLYQLPLLLVETECPKGVRTETLAFNDCWVERATGQTAWVKLSVNGEVRVPKLVGDGVLVSTAAGSSSYARAMGATPVPLNTEVLTLVGSNVLKPAFWRPAVLPMDAVVEMETVDPVRRPLHGYIDGVSQGVVRRIRVRVSRTAGAELAFAPEHDPVQKLGFVQFPKEPGDE